MDDVLHPHDNILPVYGICTDAPDGKVRLVMRYCEKGSLDDYLTGTAKLEVCFMLPIFIASCPDEVLGRPVCLTRKCLLHLACALCHSLLCRAA